MTRKSLPFRGAESVLDPLTIESEMRIAALRAADRAAAAAAPPQPMESRDPLADVLALYTDPPRRPSQLSAITVSSYAASIRQAAQQLRRIPGVAAQARAADTLPALMSPAEAQLLQLLGGSGRIDRHGIRHFDNPALASDPVAPDPAVVPTPAVNALDFSSQNTPVGSMPASTGRSWFGRQFDAITGALMPPDSPNVDNPRGDLSRQLGQGSTDSPSPPLSFSDDDGWQHGHGWAPMAYREDASGQPHWKLALPGAVRDMLSGIEDIAQQRVTPEGTLTPNAIGALMALPAAGVAPEGALTAAAAADSADPERVNPRRVVSLYHRRWSQRHSQGQSDQAVAVANRPGRRCVLWHRAVFERCRAGNDGPQRFIQDPRA